MINKGSRTVSLDTGDSRNKGPLLHLWLEDAWTKLQTTGWLSASQPRSKKLRELNNPRQFDIRLSDAWNSQRSHLSGVWESQAAKSKKNGQWWELCLIWTGVDWRDWTLPQQWSLAKIQRKRLMPVSIFCTWHSEYQDWDWIFDEQEYWFQLGWFRTDENILEMFCSPLHSYWLQLWSSRVLVTWRSWILLHLFCLK